MRATKIYLVLDKKRPAVQTAGRKGKSRQDDNKFSLNPALVTSDKLSQYDSASDYTIGSKHQSNDVARHTGLFRCEMEHFSTFQSIHLSPRKSRIKCLNIYSYKIASASRLVLLRSR